MDFGDEFCRNIIFLSPKCKNLPFYGNPTTIYFFKNVFGRSMDRSVHQSMFLCDRVYKWSGVGVTRIYNNVGDFMMVTIWWCWCQNHYIVDIECLSSISWIGAQSILSPELIVSNISHQHHQSPKSVLSDCTCIFICKDYWN